MAETGVHPNERGSNVDLQELQVELKKWAKKNFPKTSAIEQFLGIVEEVGELSHCVLKTKQKIRGGIVDKRLEEIDAIGDIAIYLINFCNYRGYDFELCLSTTAGEVLQRDWRRYPQNGVSK